MNRSFSCLLSILISPLACECVWGNTVFDNAVGGASSVTESGTSDLSSNPVNLLAENFRFSAPTLVTTVQWTGSFGRRTILPIDDFTISFFTGDDFPETQLVSFDVGDNVNRVDSGFSFDDNNELPVYEYSADVSFLAHPSTEYWLSIHNDSPSTTTNFGWARQLFPGGPADSAIFFMHDWMPYGGEHDFRLLSVPEPSSLSLVLLSAIAACFLRRKRHH